MGIKTFGARTPSRRHMTGYDFSEITKSTPEKSLVTNLKRSGGRSNNGMISIRHIGGGHKRKYRLVDFIRSKVDIAAKVIAIEYDPNRSARIALVTYLDGEKSYVLAPIGLNVGDSIISSDAADIKPGNSLKLKYIPVGTTIHNLELRPGKGGQVAKSAGVGATLVSKDTQYCQVKMPSGETRRVLSECRASIGQIGNMEHENIEIGKAGRNRWKGIRPTVRGTKMNPVDHPMGGGEGRGKGNHPQSPWGQPCKGYKTRHNKRTDAMILRRRNQK